MIDSDALGELIAELVGEHVEQALAPLVKANAELTTVNRSLSERISQLQRTIDALQPAPVITDEMISAIAARASEQIVVPSPAEADPASIVPLVLSCSAFDDRVAAAAVAAARPAPEPIAPDMSAIEDMIARQVSEAVKDIPIPAPAEPDMEVVARLIEGQVRGAVAAVPPVEPLAPDMAAIESSIAEQIAEQVKSIPLPAPVEPDMVAIGQLVADRVAIAMSELPPIEPLAPDMEAIENSIAARVSDAVSAISLPAPAEPDMEAVARMVAEHVRDAVAALPPIEPLVPDMKAIEEIVLDHVRRAVERIPAPKDGVGLAGALKSIDGHLMLTMTDGRIVDIGKIDGKNGETFTLDDFDIAAVDERTIKLIFVKGGERHDFELEFPVPIYRGVWTEGTTYSRGDMVTWAGSTWHCEEKSEAKPGEAPGHWTLAVKAGRHGRDKN